MKIVTLLTSLAEDHKFWIAVLSALLADRNTSMVNRVKLQQKSYDGFFEKILSVAAGAR